MASHWSEPAVSSPLIGILIGLLGGIFLVLCVGMNIDKMASKNQMLQIGKNC